ncbi:MAG: hypothetical protein VX023_01610 [Candidatus Thermoplasmatota archaeon]|nr:hypothetical protein [Candidatus Thermoplasmatota archaeon]
MSEDILKLFNDMSVCPVCGSIDKKGSFRCLGCGAFHSTAHLVDRDAPTPEERKIEPVDVNPLAYSMGPNQKILEEEFEQSEDVVNWQGGSTDFSFDEDISEKVDLALAKANLIDETEEL